MSLNYDPDKLLDALVERMSLKNDAALARMLEVAHPVISKIRTRKMPVGASMLIRMHETTGISLSELRGLMGDLREKFKCIPLNHTNDKEELHIL